MPHVLAPLVTKKLPGLWAEGLPYSTETIYDICSVDPKTPPVHYEQHLIKPHSICHFDALAHIIPNEKTISDLFVSDLKIFYGLVTVVRIKDPIFAHHPMSPGVQHYEVSLNDLHDNLARLSVGKIPEKLFVTVEGAETDFYAKPDRAMTLSLEAVEWLTSSPSFNLFGTVWRSTDFQPGSRERPIHKEIFKQAGILECLDLSKVPEGQYFLSAFPIPLEGAMESPVCPVLFSKGEMSID